ncbi:MAG: DUF4465 domain-containing protein [Bacteroides sp.]|nr:DUF4465 domain-containing protein [Bacteroides sp.]
MRINYYLSIAMAALVMTNCSQEEELQDIQRSGDVHTLTATIEGSTRSSVTDGGAFSWTSGDAISAWDGDSYETYTYASGNVFNGSASQLSGYAIYPQGEHPNYEGIGLPEVNMSASYNYGSTNAIMLAKVQGNSNNLSFSHLGGLMRFVIKNIPSNTTSFTFTANSGITGNFQVEEENGANVIKAATVSNSNNTVTITFEAGSLTNGKGTFYIPLPTGTYTGFTIAIGNQQYKSSATNTIKRRSLLLMPTFTCDGTKLVKGDNSVALENTTTEQNMNISGDEDLVIETPSGDDANATLNLNYTPETNSTLNISDGQTGSPTESEAKVVINVENDNKVSELNIDAPTLTVELASGEYGTVTAKTATNTLIIKEGVKIDKLIVVGGSVQVEDEKSITSKTELRVLTFEDADAQFESYYLDYVNNYEGKEITTWSDLIDDPQYMGPLTYGTDQTDAMYTWCDEGNTELTHTFPDNYAYCFWGGGHAISNYWGEGWTDEDRDTHIAKYYGEDYVEENAGNDAMLGWFNLQFMTPVEAHSGDNFAVHYGYKDFFSYVENLPEISFADGEARVIDHMWVTNTSYTLNQLYNGVKSEEGNSFGGNWSGLTEDAWLKIVAQGFDDVEADADTEPISEVEFYLVQGENVVTDWQKWDLSSLGEVVKVRFNFLYSEEMGGNYGFTIPGYFAYDDVAVRFEK